MSSEQLTDLALKNVTAGVDHLDPFQGFVDEDKQLNLRYGFRLADINFLINRQTICEVIRKPVVYPIPNTPGWILGLINLRGILVPVFDIGAQITEKSPKLTDTVLIIDKGERTFATCVESLPVSINLDEDEFISAAIPEDIPDILKGHVNEAYSMNQEIWLDINYDAFIKRLTRDYSEHPDNDET